MKISGTGVEKCLTKQVFMVNFCQQALKLLSSYSRVFTVFPFRAMLY